MLAGTEMTAATTGARGIVIATENKTSSVSSTNKYVCSPQSTVLLTCLNFRHNFYLLNVVEKTMYIYQLPYFSDGHVAHMYVFLLRTASSDKYESKVCVF